MHILTTAVSLGKLMYDNQLINQRVFVEAWSYLPTCDQHLEVEQRVVGVVRHVGLS